MQAPPHFQSEFSLQAVQALHSFCTRDPTIGSFSRPLGPGSLFSFISGQTNLATASHGLLPSSRRRFICVLISAGCDGGSKTQKPPPPQITPKVNYTITVSASAKNLPAQTISLTLTVD
jgi:hypothetical protein